MRLHSLKSALCVFMISSLTGCASVVTAWKNDPLQAYSVKQPSIYAMTGDRRTAVFSDRNSTLKYCAESLPDAVAAFAAASSAKAKAEGLKGGAGGEIGFSEQTAVALLQTFQRTEIAELSRQLGFNTCLAWAQGAITNEQYGALLVKIVDGSIDVMKERSKQKPESLVTELPKVTLAPKLKDDESMDASH